MFLHRMVVRTDGTRGRAHREETSGVPCSRAASWHPRSTGVADAVRIASREERPAARASRTRSVERMPVGRMPAQGTSGRRQAGADPAVSAERERFSRPRRGRRGRRPPCGSGCACAGSSSWSRLLSYAVVAGREMTLAASVQLPQEESLNPFEISACPERGSEAGERRRPPPDEREGAFEKPWCVRSPATGSSWSSSLPTSRTASARRRRPRARRRRGTSARPRRPPPRPRRCPPRSRGTCPRPAPASA